MPLFIILIGYYKISITRIYKGISRNEDGEDPNEILLICNNCIHTKGRKTVI